jgi:cytochrome b561
MTNIRPRSTSGNVRDRAQAPVLRANMPPRTDIGTIAIHWATAAAFAVSIITGVRIAIFGHAAPSIAQRLSWIAPQGEIWTWHFLAGLSLFFCASTYLIYIHRGGLMRRNALVKLRVLLLPTAPKVKLEAINVALHWFIYALIVIMTVTGVVLYLGYGGWWVWVHSVSAFIGIAYIFVHVASHYLQGGWWQVCRVFRPTKLIQTNLARSYPLVIAAGAGIAIVTTTAGLDWLTRDTLLISRVPSEPKLDGVFDDEVWKTARPITIRTQQGANLGGTGESLVEVRALHNNRDVFFAFKWQDPSRSLRRVPMIKREDGWHLLGNNVGVADVTTFYEDKLAVGFSRSPAFGGGDSTHLGSKPLDESPAPLHAMGYHYTAAGKLMDVWQWKATRGGHLGVVDDQYFEAPRPATPAEAAGKARYQAGYWNDPGRAFYSYNYVSDESGRYDGPVKVARLPKDWKATVSRLGKFDLNPNSIDDEGSRWWMNKETETVPYSAAVDSTIPVGTVIPGVLIAGDYEGDRADIRGGVKWKDGHWYLETMRRMKTGSKFDHDFSSSYNLYMWVNVFDHAQIRHTRHARPIRVVTYE